VEDGGTTIPQRDQIAFSGAACVLVLAAIRHPVVQIMAIEKMI